MKAIASRPGAASLKWAHPDELQAHIEQRAQERYGTDIPRARAVGVPGSWGPELPLESSSLARISTIRYPAIFAPTQEAILVAGSLVQLGDEDVQLASADILPKWSPSLLLFAG